MRLAWVSAETPDRFGHGGQRRQFNLIRALLGVGVDVRVVLLESEQDAASITAMTPTVRLPADRKLRARLTRSSSFDRVVAGIEADALLVSHTESSALVPATLRAGLLPTVVDVHNVLSRWHAALGEIGAADRERAREAKLLTTASAVVCSDEERDALLLIDPAAAVTVVRQGFDPDEWPAPAIQPTQQSTLAFFGSLWYPINIEGLRWFIEEVWPRIRTAVPAAEFCIYGAGDGSELDQPEVGIRVEGWVEDLAPWVQQASGVVVPILAGPGSRVKFPESLASGRPVVSTSVGAESFGADGLFECADDPEAFAAACVRVLSDHVRSARLGERARAYALEHLTWAAAAGRLMSAVAEARSRR